MLDVLGAFDVEEQEVINQSFENGLNLNRADMVKRIDFVVAINTDDDVKFLYEGLKAKLLALSDDEWDNVCSTLPFDLIYSSDDVFVDEEV